MALRDIGSGTTHGTPGTETTHPHNLGAVPDFVAITARANGVIYLSQNPDADNVYVKGSAASLTFDFLAMIDHSIIK